MAAPPPTPLEQSAREDAVGLTISIRTGSGSGHTPLSAFDTALLDAGVGDFNLVTLSSVIPPASRIRHVDAPLAGTHGDLLFCVRAEAFAEEPGHVAWAGLGWVLDEETGGGLFVEHHGTSEASVIEQIEASLEDMNRNRGGGYGPVQMTLASASCVDEPVCALVLAAYRVTSWFDGPAPAAVASTEHGELVSAPPAASPSPGSGPGGTHTQVLEDWAAEEAAQHHGTTRTNGSAPHPDRQPARESSGQAPRSANGSATATATATGTATATRTLANPVARVSVEREVDFATAKRFYRLYLQTFAELDHLAAGRQTLHEEEFLEEMLDPRVQKHVAWDAKDRAIGMTTLTTDLETVPWVSPVYFAHRYPEHHARGAIYYLGFTLVHPDYRGEHVFHAMLASMYEAVAKNRGVVGFDMCLANDERGLGGSAGELVASLADITVEQIDRQHYYTMTFHGVPDSPTA